MKKKTTDNNELIEIFNGLAQVTRCCRQEEAFCEGVTFQQFMILDAVVKQQGLNMADLHLLLSVEKSTTTRLVKPLIVKGLLLRNKVQSDSRAVRLTLTKEGWEVHQKVWLCLIEFFQRVVCNIPEGRRDLVLESVRTFIEAIKNSSGEYNCCK